MGVRILDGDGGAVLYCSTTDWAFGPLFKDFDQAQEFLDWVRLDVRLLSDKELTNKYLDFLVECERAEREGFDEHAN